MDKNLQAFNVSDNAARKISSLLKDEQEADGKYMRVAVEGGGCSGFQYIFKTRAVLICLVFGLLPMFLAMPFQNILVVMAEETWQTGESGVGILMATGGIGGVIGALWIVKKGDNGGYLGIMLGSTFFFGVFLAVFTKTTNLSFRFSRS